MEDEGACEDGFLPDALVNEFGYRRLSDDRLRGGSCGLGFSFGFVEVDMVKYCLSRAHLSHERAIRTGRSGSSSLNVHFTDPLSTRLLSHSRRNSLDIGNRSNTGSLFMLIGI
jgi:hypothetical protein